jgi:hypothetical protein
LSEENATKQYGQPPTATTVQSGREPIAPLGPFFRTSPFVHFGSPICAGVSCHHQHDGRASLVESGFYPDSIASIVATFCCKVQLEEKRREVAALTKQLADNEEELNDRVFRLFKLTADEIRLLQREVEH